MKEFLTKVYECEVCNTKYSDPKDAIKCEKHAELLSNLQDDIRPYNWVLLVGKYNKNYIVPVFVVKIKEQSEYFSSKFCTNKNIVLSTPDRCSTGYSCYKVPENFDVLGIFDIYDAYNIFGLIPRLHPSHLEKAPINDRERILEVQDKARSDTKELLYEMLESDQEDFLDFVLFILSQHGNTDIQLDQFSGLEEVLGEYIRQSRYQ